MDDRAVGRAPGSFGEILQGRGRRVGDFLVTLPIARFSTAEARAADAPFSDIAGAPEKTKAAAAVRAWLARYATPDAAQVSVSLATDLPVGEGLASSTADCVAALRAVAGQLGRDLPAADISTILAGVEPHDGVMYDAPVVYDHRAGALRRRLRPTPPLRLVSARLKPPTSTAAFNAELSFSDADLDFYDDALSSLIAALDRGDLADAFGLAHRAARRFVEGRGDAAYGAFLDAAEPLIDPSAGVFGSVVCHSGSRAALVVASDVVARRASERLAERLPARAAASIERIDTLSGEAPTAL